ncbi:uncharacterized protein LOC122316264 [Carya illinoinensis]|uniref:uncharacterized protein LOC122316264 n=1 Tax=Carya illinoinensis TaxID=32201 RepID=UPI001C71BB4C|nr:uncharacterized protein LOC122316264 [Carya illinoinensis]
MHALWSCVSVQDVWSLCSRKLQKGVVRDYDFKELWSHMISALDSKEQAEFAAIVYQIWKRRNNFIFENKFWEPGKVVEAATQAVFYYSEANEKVVAVQDRPTLSVPSWSAPLVNVFKANWDPAIDKVKCKIGVGVVIRNWEASVVASLRSPKDFFLILI